MISRKNTKKIIIMLFITLAVFLVASSMKHIWLMALCLPLMAYDYWLIYKTNVCPKCGEHFKGLHWSAPDAGECPNCGTILEYDE